MRLIVNGLNPGVWSIPRTDDKLYTSLSANTIIAKLTNHVQRTRLITSSTDKRYSLDSEDDFRSGCRNVSHQQQFFSELASPGRSHYTNWDTLIGVICGLLLSWSNFVTNSNFHAVSVVSVYPIVHTHQWFSHLKTIHNWNLKKNLCFPCLAPVAWIYCQPFLRFVTGQTWVFDFFFSVEASRLQTCLLKWKVSHPFCVGFMSMLRYGPAVA